MTGHSHHGNPRRRSLRLRNYDYASPGAYFITICSHRGACLFGRIAHGLMRLNALGTLVETCWHALPTHYPHVELDAFVVIPNHVHGILVLADESPKRHGLPEIVRAFKTLSSRRVNEMRDRGGTPIWQRGYYEHVIRNEGLLGRIRDYVETNPCRWELDKENPKNIGAGSNPPLPAAADETLSIPIFTR